MLKDRIEGILIDIQEELLEEGHDKREVYDRSKEVLSDNVLGYDLIKTNKSNKNFDKFKEILEEYIYN